jgi:hypothetical protein
MLPPVWRPEVQLLNGEPAPQAVLETKVVHSGTAFPYGCRYCARSTSRDSVEFCDTVMGVVHADCHEDECGGCAAMLCTEDRCDHREECDGCYNMVCRRHGVSDCAC